MQPHDLPNPTKIVTNLVVGFGNQAAVFRAGPILRDTCLAPTFSPIGGAIHSRIADQNRPRRKAQGVQRQLLPNHSMAKVTSPEDTEISSIFLAYPQTFHSTTFLATAVPLPPAGSNVANDAGLHALHINPVVRGIGRIQPSRPGGGGD